MSTVDLMKLTEAGGCSAKLPAGKLKEIVSEIPVVESDKLLVGNNTSDDALVYQISSETALIQTTDFFPPVCSNPYDFGQIAAANSLSDVYAMGGLPVTALNIVMFPSADMDAAILREILRGGAEKVLESGAVLAGGHTIDGSVPVYGLAVTGTVHPDKVIKNSSAKPGDLLILTKALGTGVITAGRRIEEASDEVYTAALDSMKQLHAPAVGLLHEYNVKCATDVTGFSLAGHALEIAKGSGVTVHIDTGEVPLLPGTRELLELGCIPGASFRNLKFIEPDVHYSDSVNYNLKMAAVDAQTSGGLLISAPANAARELCEKLVDAGFSASRIIGEVLPLKEKHLEIA